MSHHDTNADDGTDHPDRICGALGCTDAAAYLVETSNGTRALCTDHVTVHGDVDLLDP